LRIPIKEAEIKVSQEKLDRLWGHLLKVEEIAGRKLLKKPRHGYQSCPIANFCPIKGKNGERFQAARDDGTLVGLNGKYKIYEPKDSLWWRSLTWGTKTEITNWIIQKIKERNEQI